MDWLKPGDKFTWDHVQQGWVLEELKEMLGRPYERGAKWKDGERQPFGKIDCSGLVRWAFSLRGLLLPHGSFNQIAVCKKWPHPIPVPLCLGFADLSGADGVVDHVNIVFNADSVIEARADFGKVVRRPISNWEKQKGFLGWHYVPGTVAV